MNAQYGGYETPVAQRENLKAAWGTAGFGLLGGGFFYRGLVARIQSCRRSPCSCIGLAVAWVDCVFNSSKLSDFGSRDGWSKRTEK